MSRAKSFFKTREKLLALAFTAYMVMLILAHWQLPSLHVWLIAAVFSVLINFTYIIEAISLKTYAKTEALVATFLILASILGLMHSPLILIFAILGHGIWDLLKHFGKGVPFYSWYTCSCFLVDTAYSSTLLFYYFYRS